MKLNLGIMITTKCNRACPHCLFFCSPNNKDASDLDIPKALFFINTIPESVEINEICIYGGEPTLDYKRLKNLIDKLPNAKKIQILANGYLKNPKDVERFKDFCKWFNKKKNIIKISNDIYHDIFQSKEIINSVIKTHANVVWKRREASEEFIKMGRWEKHPTVFTKPPNCTIEEKTLIIQQDAKINFCCGGYSAAIGTCDDDFTKIIEKRHKFIRFLREKEKKISHNTCKKCRSLFSEYFDTSYDIRWGK